MDILQSYPFSQRKAHVYERLNMKLLIAEDYTGKGGSTPLYVAKQNLFPGYCGWPLAPNTPFKANLDQYILAFHGVIVLSFGITKS